MLAGGFLFDTFDLMLKYCNLCNKKKNTRKDEGEDLIVPLLKITQFRDLTPDSAKPENGIIVNL